MKRIFCISAFLWLAVLTAAPLPSGAPRNTPAAAAETIKTPQGSLPGKTPGADTDIERILSGEARLPVVTGDELAERLDREVVSLYDWLDRERDQIFRSLIGCAAILLIGAGMIWIGRKLRVRHPPESASLRWQLAEALTPPLIVFFVVCGVFAFLLPLLHALPELYPWDARVFFTLLALAAAWIGFRLISLIDLRLTRIARRADNNLDTLMVEITRKFLKISLALFTLLFIGQSIFNLNITTLLAGAGVIGLAIAFASRETLSNFFGTLVIILDRPFRVGDRIRVNGTDGLVESVGMRSTRLQTDEESCVTIPNSRIAEASIENISSRGVIRYSFTLGMEYTTTPDQLERVMAIAHEVADNFEGPDQKRYRPRVFFSGFGNSTLNVRVIMWLKTTDFATEEKWRTRINLELMRRFNAEGLNMAFNTVTAYLRGEPDFPLFGEQAPPVSPRASDSPSGGKAPRNHPAEGKTPQAAPPPPATGGKAGNETAPSPAEKRKKEPAGQDA